MRNSRLFEILYLLLEKECVTARELAERFEVSVRTISRDLDALSAAGIPVYAARGRGGGIRLLPGFVLDRSLLSADEQNEILFALQSMAALGAPLDQDVLPRLRALFGRPVDDWLDVDFSRWGSGPQEKRIFESIKTGILQHQVLSFTYFSSYGQRTARTVEPVRLCFKGGAWYLQAFCRAKQAYRTFKISRMADVALTGEQFAPRTDAPPPLDDPENTLPMTRLRARLSGRMAFRVYDEFDPTQIEPQPDGSYLVTLDWPLDSWGYSYLLSFGSALEVLEPAYVRDAMRGELEKLLRQYQK